MTTICRKPIEQYMGRTFLGVAVFFSGSQAFAQRGPSFEGLGTLAAPDFEPGTLATGVSANGLVVIGFTRDASLADVSFRWTRSSGFLILPLVTGSVQGIPRGVSGDGSIVVGSVHLRSSSRAFRWKLSQGNTISLGDLPGGDVYSEAEGVSTDGSVIVGRSKSVLGIEAFRWTPSGGMVGMGFLPGATGSRAYDASADGSVIVGGSFGPQGAGGAFRWTAIEGMVPVGLSAGFVSGDAELVSADGLVVVGIANNANAPDDLEAFRWTAAGGMVGLGQLFGGLHRISTPTGVSADGSVIVGYSESISNEPAAFIWDTVHGMRNLKSVLENEVGLDLTEWFLDSAEGVSADGRVIAGSGGQINTAGPQAWIAVLSECGTDADCSDGLFCNGVETCVSNVCTPGTPPCETGDPCLESAGVCTSSIPTVSQWGLIAMTLLLVTATTCILKQRTVPER